MSLLEASEKSGLIKYRVEKAYTSLNIDENSVGHEKHTGISKSIVALSLGSLGLIISLIMIAGSTIPNTTPLQGTPVPVSRLPVKMVTHPEIPSPYWGAVLKPYPTGAFWTNLVVKNGDGSIGVLPYGVKCVEAGVQVSYGAFRRIVSPIAVFDPFVTDLQISAIQGYTGRGVETYDNVSVTMAYHTSGNGKFRTHLVKGSPFITVVYEGATPVISSAQMQFLNVEARLIQGRPGTRYIVTLGNNQKWLIYCSEGVAFTWKDNSLTAAGPIRGVVRVAFLPTQNAETAFNFLVNYVSRYPTGAQVTMSYPSANNMILSFQYITQGSGSLLMLAVPHQVQLMSGGDSDETRAAQDIYAPIYCAKGKMKPIVGDYWRLTYTLSQAGWNYALADKLSIAQLDNIAYWLQMEVKSMPPAAADTYNFGKELGRMARLALIADNLGIADARQVAVSVLENSLNSWLQSSNSDALVYDRTWGGIVSTHGLTDSSMNADYGLGWYNDHHFHFGYFIYAFATLAKLDPLYVEPRRAMMELLVRDVCTYDPTDTDFPFARHKDFFDGHSWASGLFQQGNGKNQESSSEAVNAYYACYLYGLATANTDLTSFGHALMTMEIQATQIYWHMRRDSDVYDDVFRVSGMAGNVGALDVTTTTWFGPNLEYVHGINMMPVTPALAAMFDQPYVEEQWAILQSRLPPTTPSYSTECAKNSACSQLGLTAGSCCPTTDGAMLACCDGANSKAPHMIDEWLSLLYIDHAVVDREAAWTQILSLQGLGVGNSKANALFWAASRPPPRSTYNSSHRPVSPQHAVKPACAANSACDAMGMVDDCCPSASGIFLGCCPKTSVFSPIN